MLDELVAQFADTDIRKFTRAKLLRFYRSLEASYAQIYRADMPLVERKKVTDALQAFFDLAILELAVRFQGFTEEGECYFTGPLPPPFTRADMVALLEACRTDPQGSVQEFNDQSFLLLLVDTGLWKTELCRLRVKDVNINQGEVYVWGEGNKNRTIRVGRTSRKSISRYLLERGDTGPDESLFITNSGGGLTTGEAHELLRRTGRKSGIKEIDPIRFRVTFAALCINDAPAQYYLNQHFGYDRPFDVLNAISHFLTDIFAEHTKYSPVSRWKL